MRTERKTTKKYFRVIPAILLATATLCLPVRLQAADNPVDDLTKQDLYNMILELRQEVRELKANAAPGAQPAEDEIRAIVHQEVADQAMTDQGESLLQRIQIHGSLSQGYLKTDHNNWMGETEDGTFNFNEFSINFSADLTDKLRAGLQLMSRDLGSMVNNEVRLDWAVMDYAWQDALSLRGGLLKVPLGFYNESRDVDAARTGVLLPQGFYGEAFRELYNGVMGVAIYGNLDLRKVGTVSYLAVYGDQDLDKDGEIARNAIGRGLIDQSSVAEVTADHTAALGITWDTPLEGLRLNSSYYQSNVRLTGSKTIAENVVNGALKVNNYYTWTTGAEYTWNDLVVAAEYRQARVPSEFSVDGQLVASMTSTGEYWYVSSGYRFADWFTGEISYSEAYPYRDDKNGDRFDDSPGNERFYAWSKIWSFNGRFDINDYWILKAGIDFNNGMATGFNFQNPDGADEDWILYQLKTTVTF
jgi:hypothetical protein